MQSNSKNQVVVRTALLCMACDIPDSHKARLVRNRIILDLTRHFGNHVVMNPNINMHSSTKNVQQLVSRKLSNGNMHRL